MQDLMHSGLETWVGQLSLKRVDWMRQFDSDAWDLSVEEAEESEKMIPCSRRPRMTKIEMMMTGINGTWLVWCCETNDNACLMVKWAWWWSNVWKLKLCHSRIASWPTDVLARLPVDARDGRSAFFGGLWHQVASRLHNIFQIRKLFVSRDYRVKKHYLIALQRLWLAISSSRVGGNNKKDTS